jgi:dephospho-CoA kinase
MPYRILRQGSLPAEEIMDTLVSGMTIVGITGGSGCGKTTALKELEKRGALLLDCDAVYHELLQNSESLITELKTAFPGTVEDGVLRRDRLGEIVFQDAEKLKLLNEITHRHIMAEITGRLRSRAMQGGTLAALDAIELIGSGLAEICDVTIAVTASDETRIARIMERDGISREKAELRIRAQRPNAWFEENCDFTLSNDGDRESFIRTLNEYLEERLNHGEHERKPVL